MRPLIMKFGGTSVADAAAISGVVRLVRSAVASGDPAVVVVSAMSGVTDELLRACELARTGNVSAAEAAVDSVEGRHRAAIEGTVADADSLLPTILGQCDELRSVLNSVAVLRELTPRGADRVAAAGELMSSRIVAAALTSAGTPAQWIDPRRVLITDDGRPVAIPLLDATRAAAARELQPIVDAGEVAVTGGFVGATAAGITTTLGRGGSDLSASVLGAALNAREIQIWTDVDGMLTADPRVVEGAEVGTSPVVRRSVRARILRRQGAASKHHSSRCRRRDTRPDSQFASPRGSRQPDHPPCSPDGRPLTALASKRNITVIDVTSTRMLLAHGFLRRVFEVFEQHATSVDVVTTSEVSVSMTLDDDRRLAAIERDLRLIADVKIEQAMAIVSAVGDNLRRDPALAVRLIAALEGLQLRMVSQAASRRNLTVVLADRDVPAAMQRLHQEFFTSARSAR